MACLLAEVEGALSAAYAQLHVHLKPQCVLLSNVRRLLFLDEAQLLNDLQTFSAETSSHSASVVSALLPKCLTTIHIVQRIRRPTDGSLETLIGASDTEIFNSCYAYTEEQLRPASLEEKPKAQFRWTFVTSSKCRMFRQLGTTACLALQEGHAFERPCSAEEALSEGQLLLLALRLLQRHLGKDLAEDPAPQERS